MDKVLEFPDLPQFRYISLFSSLEKGDLIEANLIINYFI